MVSPFAYMKYYSRVMKLVAKSIYELTYNGCFLQLDRAYEQFIEPLEEFRRKHIGAVKERKKKFEKQTAKFCASQERYLGLSTKKQDAVLQEVSVS